MSDQGLFQLAAIPFVLLAACGGGSAATATGDTTPPPGADAPGQVRVDSGDKIGGEGALDPRVVLDALQAHIGDVRTCYRHELDRDALLHGRVVVEFTIGHGGGVSEIVARADGIGDPAVASCVTGMVSALYFTPPPTGGDVRFRYPFVFDP